MGDVVHHEGVTKCSTAAVVTFALGLVAGTFSALFCKAAYETVVIVDGVEKNFYKPIMVLTLMFAAMTPAFLFWIIQQAFTEPKNRDHFSYKTVIVLIVPCLCDLSCTLLLLIAQIYITASMWQMLRGSVICITALLKCFVLNHRLRAHMWAGVAVITLAMIVVASVPFISPEKSEDSSETVKDPRLGVIFVLLGCLAQGVQYVFEEKVMAVDNVPPLVVIGFEGIWGTILSVLVVYPLASIIPGKDVGGVYESPAEAIRMIQLSPLLQNFLIGFVITVTIYNCLVVYVTKYLSAIWHAILDNFRPLTIWGVSLFVHYSVNPAFGETWTVPGSYVQLVGLLFLFLGTAVYDGRVAECDDSHEYARISPIDEDDIPSRFEDLSSSLLSKSPLIYRRERDSIDSEHKAIAVVKALYSEI